MLKELWTSWQTQKTINRFVTLLATSVNLPMIEIARGKIGKNFIKTKKFQEQLEDSIDFLISKFTYKEWRIILSMENTYHKASANKTEDVRINLRKFLTTHYKEVYDIFDMTLYDEFQTKEQEEIHTLLLAQDVFLNETKITAILFYYQDGSRMCYCPETGKRLVVENIEVKTDSILITLVEKKSSVQTQWKNWFHSFFKIK